MSLLSLKTNVTENALHLAFIVPSEVTPQFNDNWLEIIVYVVALIDQLNGMGTLRFVKCRLVSFIDRCWSIDIRDLLLTLVILLNIVSWAGFLSHRQFWINYLLQIKLFMGLVVFLGAAHFRRDILSPLFYLLLNFDCKHLAHWFRISLLVQQDRVYNPAYLLEHLRLRPVAVNLLE